MAARKKPMWMGCLLLGAGEYFDTYFRLLREDCISAIRHSIAYVREHGLGRNGPKQEREADDNVFRATLKGFTVGKGASVRG